MSTPGLHILSKSVGPMDNNCYAVIDDEQGVGVFIDPSFGSTELLQEIPESVRIEWVLLTHGHFDHVAEASAIIRATGACLAIHRGDEGFLEKAPEMAAAFGLRVEAVPTPGCFLEHGQAIRVGNHGLRVVHTPGHSPGGVCFLLEGAAIVGDVLFNGSIGRTDLPGGDHATLLQSIRQELLTLPDHTRVLPGHGLQTTIGDERSSNPFIAGL